MTEVLIIDARNLLWRAGDANRELSARLDDGTVIGTGAIYGFLRIACKVHGQFPKSKIFIAWEGSKNFRFKLWPDYKKRNKGGEDGEVNPDFEMFLEDLRAQEKRLQQLLAKLNVRQYTGHGCEADDVMGTIAYRAAKQGLNVVIYSGDGDMHQMASPKVKVLMPGHMGRKEKLYDVAAVKDKWGVHPKRLADFKALAGDTSDNYPGVVGVGPKKALALLDTYEDAAAVLNAAKTKDKAWPLSEKLREATASAKVGTFKAIALILRNAKVKVLEAEPTKDPLAVMLRRYKLRSLMSGEAMAELVKLGG
jgi:DNA polymerase-1